MTKLEQTVASLQKYKPYHTVEVIEKLGGLSNDNYLFMINGYKTVVRVPGEAMSELEVSTLLSESLNAAKFAEVSDNFVPIKIVNGIKVQPYVENAKTLENSDIQELAGSIGGILCRMHETTPQLVTHFNLNAVLNKYTTAYFVRTANLDVSLQVCVNLARQIDGYLRKHKAHKVPSHNDPLAANWLENTKTGEIYLIDYEYAGQNYYAFDLAAIVTECDLSKQQIDTLVSSYCFMSNDIKTIDRVKYDIDACIFYQEVLWSLWAFTKSMNFEGEIIDNEMYEYAKSRLFKATNRLEYTQELINNF